MPAPHNPAHQFPTVDPAARRPVTVSVDKSHCQLYGICAQEAAAVFALDADGRLRYTTRPAAGDIHQLRQAARCCPTQAITLTERRP